MRLKPLLAITGLSAALFAGNASAVFINGLVSLSDGFTPGTIGTTTQIVSGLNVLNQQAVGSPTGCTGNFATGAACTAATFTAGTINLLAPPNLVYTYAGFTFTATSYTAIVRTGLICANGTCTDALVFLISGNVTGNGLQSTQFFGTWSGNGSCIQGVGTSCNGQSSASWSISLAAIGAAPPTVPEPSSIALLGLGVGLLGFATRRRKA